MEPITGASDNSFAQGTGKLLCSHQEDRKLRSYGLTLERYRLDPRTSDPLGKPREMVEPDSLGG